MKKGGSAVAGPPPAPLFLLLHELIVEGVLDRATRALHFTGTASLEQAIDWIMKHQDDPDVDEPLLVDKVGAALVRLGYVPCRA